MRVVVVVVGAMKGSVLVQVGTVKVKLTLITNSSRSRASHCRRRVSSCKRQYKAWIEAFTCSGRLLTHTISGRLGPEA